MLRGILIELKVNNKEETKLAQHAGVARHAYNQALAYCMDLFKQGKRIPSSIDLHKWIVAEVKTKYPWYYDVSKCAPQQATRDLVDAYSKFHKTQKASNYTLKNKKGELKGLPNFKKKYQGDSFYLESPQGITIQDSKIKLPNIGWIRLTEEIDYLKIKNCTISRHADKWYVSFKRDLPIQYTKKEFDSVGVDLGIKNLAILSNGEVIPNKKPYENAKNKLKKLQQEQSRRYVKDAESQSKNYKKTAQKVAKLHKKIGDIRKDYIHQLTSYLAKKFETVIVENLNVKSMTKNSRLSSAILDGGFYEFKRQMTYKKEIYGGNLIIADQYFPSSKKCSCCGNVKKKLSLSERTYNCEKCGLSKDRDDNSAINLDNLKILLKDIHLEIGDAAGSLTVKNAFGEGKLGKPFILGELGMKHQIYTFKIS